MYPAALRTSWAAQRVKTEVQRKEFKFCGYRQPGQTQPGFFRRCLQ